MKEYHQRYINEFLSMKSAPLFIEKKVFPNSKEITESMAINSAIRENFSHYHNRRNNDNIACVCVGDGHTPRTAMLMAHLSRWMCFSVDPYLKIRDYSTNRLLLFRDKIENVEYDFSNFDSVLIVMVHSHATIENAMKSIRNKSVDIISIPCCVNHFVEDYDFHWSYRDESIWSPQNEVKLWYNVR